MLTALIFLAPVVALAVIFLLQRLETWALEDKPMRTVRRPASAAPFGMRAGQD